MALVSTFIRYTKWHAIRFKINLYMVDRYKKCEMPKSLVEIHLDLLVVVKTLQVAHQTGAAPLEVNQEGACHHTSIFFDFLYTIWQ